MTSSGSPAIDYVETAPVSKKSTVVYAEFSAVDSHSLPEDFIEIDEFVSEQEKDPQFENALKQSRRLIADKIYPEPETISKLRLERGLSQKQLADLIGSSQPHIARIESGREDIRLSTVKKLSEALDLSVSEVIDALEKSGGYE